MSRTGMSTLISTIRGLCNLGTDDYTLGTATFWADNDVQTVLDRHRADVREELLVDAPEYVNGTTHYNDFYSGFGNFEDTTGGTAIFTVENSGGTVIATTLYTPDYSRGVVVFGTTQAGSSRYLTGRSYDIYGAAADVYRMKAGAYSESVNFKTDNMSVNRGDAVKQCMGMANYYATLGNTRSVEMSRDDAWA